MFVFFYEWNCKLLFYKIIGYKMFYNFKMCIFFVKGGILCNLFCFIEIVCLWFIKCELNFYVKYYDVEIFKYLIF